MLKLARQDVAIKRKMLQTFKAFVARKKRKNGKKSKMSSKFWVVVCDMYNHVFISFVNLLSSIESYLVVTYLREEAISDMFLFQQINPITKKV